MQKLVFIMAFGFACIVSGARQAQKSAMEAQERSLDKDPASRPKREDGYEELGRIYDATERVLLNYNARDECFEKNMMACKQCRASVISGLTLNEWSGSYEIWCFDEGHFFNQGDGGFRNWRYKGCWAEGGVGKKDVIFVKCLHQLPPAALAWAQVPNITFP